MPPPKKDDGKVKKKKKKTKEELEEERRQAEEAARLAEEERLRLEELERQRLAELERQRLELLSTFLAQEGEQLEIERLQLEPLTGQRTLERAQAAQQRREDWEWRRFLSCTYVPHPTDRVAMGDFLAQMQELPTVVVQETLTTCQDCYNLMSECAQFRLESQQRLDDKTYAIFCQDIATLHELVGLRIDRMTAHVLHHADEHANERLEVQLGVQQGDFQWAVWVNTAKNPRMKTVEMPQLHMVIEIPKSIALASVAMRVQHRMADEFYARCTNEFMAVGGVLYVDLLALPPPAKKVKQWVLRQVTPLSYNVSRIPYPIPPAGADPATYRSEEEPPPLGFTFPFTPNMVLLDSPIKVGWWDTETMSWNTSGITNVSYSNNGVLSFHSCHLGPLAVLQSRARLLPYRSWDVRPTGGRNGATAAVSVHVGLAEPIVFNVGPGYVKLATTMWPQLAGIQGTAMQPAELLQQLSHAGLHLLPEDRDAAVVGVTVKDRVAEGKMCMDLALLGSVFLICRSRWNQTAQPSECIARISEVLDWEEGGRTEARHLERIFAKEKEDGERRVLAVMQRGDKGIAFCDALDRREEYPVLPGHESVEAVQACMDTIWGEIHTSLLSLLKGPNFKDEHRDSPRVLRLQATPESLDLVRNTNALFTETLGQVLLLLRVFSFS